MYIDKMLEPKNYVVSESHYRSHWLKFASFNVIMKIIQCYMLNTIFGGIIKSVISFYRIKETLVRNHTSKRILIFLTHCWLLIILYSTL